jgi:P4 family phage/plasmid primase-like protien
VIQHQFTSIRMFDGQLFGYEAKTGRYLKLDPEQVKARISRFIDQRLELTDGKDIVAPTSWHVRETFAALCEQVMLPAAKEPPCWIGEGVPPWGDARVLTCGNGILDPLADKLYEHDPRWFSFSTVAANYNPQADCESWKTFLKQLWPDDQESADCLAEFYAATIMQETRYQKVFGLKGPKRAGKGVCMDVAAALLGEERVTRLSVSDLINNFGLEGIIGRSAVFIGDARINSSRDNQIAIERLLKLSGGDRPSIPRKFKGNYEGPLDCLFWFSFNILPALNDGDASGALPGRFQFLRYFKSFFGQEDPDLLTKLKGELDGIFLFAIAGWKRLHARQRFVTPEAAEGTAYQNAQLNTALSDFVEECCLLHPEAVSNKDAKFSGMDPLFERYQAWADERKIKRPKSRSEFYREIDSITGVNTAFVRDPVTGKKRDERGKDAPYRVLGIYVRGAIPVRYDGSLITLRNDDEEA